MEIDPRRTLHQAMISTDGSCPTVYGPLPSRRHGLSLGINLGSPLKKVCTWGCVYCQCGMGERRVPNETDGVPALGDILQELRNRLGSLSGLDSVTFAGNSEPTEYPEFKELVIEIQKIRLEMKAKWKLICLSNGSGLRFSRAVEACDSLDQCWIKLDCATDDLFRRLNRPLDSAGGVQEQIQRIQKLGRPRLQSLLWVHDSVPNLGNFTESNLNALISAYRRIRPVEVHLTTVSRDTAVQGLRGASEKDLEAFARDVKAAGISVRIFS